MNILRFLVPLYCLMAALPAFAAPVERELSISLSVDGTQAWRNAAQWSKSSTTQRYEIGTRLHSDGRLYIDNLLDPDMDRRMRIKSEYYTYRGLLELKQEYGGRVPSYAEVSQRIKGESSALSQARKRCVDAADCPNVVAERFAAITALQSNTSQDLEAFIASYDEPGGRYMIFSGYESCPNRMQLVHRTQFAGEQAYDREKKKLQPFSLDWKADSKGSAADQNHLCERYVAVLDVSTGQFSLENAYIPSARGEVLSVIAAVRKQSEADLPVPYEVLRWVNDHMQNIAESGRQSATLRITQPLDGNATVLGNFDGSVQVVLSWSFKKAIAAPAQR